MFPVFDPNPENLDFWLAAGSVAGYAILAMGAAGVVIAAVQIRRLFRGR